MKLKRQVVIGLMKEGRDLFIQRGTEEILEDQGQKPGECYHFRAGQRTWGPQKGHGMREQRQRAKKESISRQEWLT